MFIEPLATNKINKFFNFFTHLRFITQKGRPLKRAELGKKVPNSAHILNTFNSIINYGITFISQKYKCKYDMRWQSSVPLAFIQKIFSACTWQFSIDIYYLLKVLR